MEDLMKQEGVLKLNKQTVANLSNPELAEIMAGADGGGDGFPACWENLWTLYWCSHLWTTKWTEDYCPE